MSDNSASQDSMEFLRKMWGNMGIPIPGMITPTLDVDEIEKRVTDLKAVEGWLKMNLNMLQLHIQCLEMQRTTLAAMQNLGQGGGQEAGTTGAPPNPFMNPAMWPWNVMQQVAAAAGASPPAPEKKD